MDTRKVFEAEISNLLNLFSYNFFVQAFTVTSFLKYSAFIAVGSKKNQNQLPYPTPTSSRPDLSIMQLGYYQQHSQYPPAASYPYGHVHFFLWSWFIICTRSNGLTNFYRTCVACHPVPPSPKKASGQGEGKVADRSGGPYWEDPPSDAKTSQPDIVPK